MKLLLMIAAFSLFGCNPAKRAGRSIDAALKMRDAVAANVVIPRDSVVYKPGKIVETFRVDTVNNLIRERYYYNSKDTIEKTIYDNEKSEALTRMYYEAKGEINIMKLNAEGFVKREKYYLIAIAIFIVILIINAKFKFL